MRNDEFCKKISLKVTYFLVLLSVRIGNTVIIKGMKIKIVKNELLRVLLLCSGFLCVLLGIIGAILPIVPTTPFLILATVCFSYSSESFYRKIISNKYFGKNVQDYLEGRGIPFKAKISAVGIMWLSIGVSIFWMDIFWLQGLMILFSVFLTWFILKQPTTN